MVIAMVGTSLLPCVIIIIANASVWNYCSVIFVTLIVRCDWIASVGIFLITLSYDTIFYSVVYNI